MSSLLSSTHLIDFHSHYFDPSWTALTASQSPVAHAWPLLTDIAAQLAVMDEAGIAAKVLTAPPALLATAGEPLTMPLIERINDRFAELIAAHPGRLLGLATIDAFQGEHAAREVERAVNTLGLGGICVDCAQGDRFLDEPQALPTLEAAARLRVPVFVHPVSPAHLTARLARFGHIGVLMARGTETAVSILTMLRAGILDELPDLTLVIPMIAASSLIFAGLADQDYRREEDWRGSFPSELRKRLYIDTMCFDPASIRFAVNFLGADHVLLGSDWPIMPITPRARVEEILMELDVSDEQQAAIAGGNTKRLLRLT